MAVFTITLQFRVEAKDAPSAWRLANQCAQELPKGNFDYLKEQDRIPARGWLLEVLDPLINIYSATLKNSDYYDPRTDSEVSDYD